MNNFKHPLNNIIKSQKNGVPKGIYSICSANEYVIEVALKYAMQKKYMSFLNLRVTKLINLVAIPG